jgi:hypothetical protein
MIEIASHRGNEAWSAFPNHIRELAEKKKQTQLRYRWTLAKFG